MKISLLTPTRNRPANVQRLVESAVETAQNPEDLEFVFYVDSDARDTSLPDFNFFEHIYKKHKTNCIVTFGDRVVLSEMWNIAYSKASGEIFMHCGDDIVFKTKDWDSMVRSAFEQIPDRIAFVHGDDGANKDAFGTHGFIHKNWVDVVGYFVPPYFSSDYNDTWLNEVANGLTRRLYLPFLTEHMHFMFGKGPKDQTHIDRLERHGKDNVMELYESKKPERMADVAKLKKFIENFKNV